MIISKAVAVQQANSLLHLYNYRKLKICTMEETEIVLAGSILINRSAKGFQLCKEYSVKIVIPIESENSLTYWMPAIILIATIRTGI